MRRNHRTPRVMRRNDRIRRAAVALLAAAILGACADAPSGAGGAGKVSFTWLGVAHWIVETPVGSLLLDAYASRPPFTPAGPTTAGLELFRSIEAAVAPPPPVRWIFVGHSHFDHALD